MPTVPIRALLAAATLFATGAMPATVVPVPAPAIATATATAPVSVQVQVHDARGKPLADAVVFLESREAKAAVRPLRDVAIEQINKQFSPRVTVVPVGSLVSFPNRDKVRHHVYSFSAIKAFELKLYAGTPANPVEFDRSGIAVLGCNIHDDMLAWVVVVETPYYARTAADGRATLNAPAGSYRLRAWHDALPVGASASDQTLDVATSGSAATVRLSEARP